MERRTIVMLSAKRCGSTAVFRMFQRHPDVGVCHVNPEIPLWEPNFWNLAARAIAGDPAPFVERFTQSHPFLRLPQRYSEDAVFALWDAVLEELGPAVFDKSPKYLGDRAAMALLSRYRDRGRDVRLFAFIRDPRDAITSQHELWRSHFKGRSMGFRESHWLGQYAHLEELQDRLGDIPLFRYEEFSAAPHRHAPMLLRHCGVSDVPACYEHLRPTSVGRYSASLLPSIRRWRFSDEFLAHLDRYGYPRRQLAPGARWRVFWEMLGGNLRRALRTG